MGSVALLGFSAAAGIVATALVWSIAGMFAGHRAATHAPAAVAFEESFGSDVPPDSEKGLRMRALEAIGVISDRGGFTGFFSKRLTAAGLAIRPSEFIFMHLLFVIGLAVAVQVLVGNLLVSLVAIVVGVIGPFVALDALVRRRTAAFEAQLPDILGLIGSSLRAGWGIQQAIGLAVEEIAEPGRGEFSRVQSQVRLGLSLEDALDRMAKRIGSTEFTWTVAVISIQREVGGNLAEVLDTVAETIRERAELRGHVRSLTAEGRLTAWILSVLPFLLVAMLWFVGREYLLRALTSPFGLGAYAFAALLLIVGIVWLVKTVEVEA